ncbi:MAG: DUF6569 family protein [Pseudonocardia sp.]
MERADIHLGNPAVRGPLTVFPVFNGAAVARPGYRLDHAALAVAEREGAPRVDELVVRNEAAEAALVLEGEVLEGGWQHRVAVRSAMVRGGEAIVLPVRCVEQGRWSGAVRHERRGRRAPVAVRAAADEQAAVWERVGRYGASATGSLLETTDRVERTAARLVAGLAPLPFQTGVLFGVGGQPLLLEVFDCPDTLGGVWDRLLTATAIDAVGAPVVATPGRRARRLVQRLRSVPLHNVDGGAGLGRHGSSDRLRLSTLTWHGRAVHTVAVNLRHGLVAA